MKYLSVRTCLGLVAVLRLANAAFAQTDPPAWSATTAYKVGNIVSYGGINFQCLINETTNRPNPHIPADWDISFVYSGNVTIPVGPTAACTSLLSAWNYIKLARIAVGSTITISLQSGYNDTLNENFSLDHPFGSQIFITGNNTGQVMNFIGEGQGFVLDSGHVFGGLQGLEIAGPPNFGSGGTPAIEVKQKAVLATAANLKIQNFYIGLEADSGEIDNVSQVTITQFQTGGFLSSGQGAVINVVAGSILVNGGTTSNATPLYGFQATQGGSISCPGCVVNNCQQDFMATSTGSLYCNGSEANNMSTAAPFYSDYFAAGHGTIIAENSSCSGGKVGYQCDRSSYMDLYATTANAYSNVGYYATNLSQIDANGSLGGSINHDSNSAVITGP